MDSVRLSDLLEISSDHAVIGFQPINRITSGRPYLYTPAKSIDLKMGGCTKFIQNIQNRIALKRRKKKKKKKKRGRGWKEPESYKEKFERIHISMTSWHGGNVLQPAGRSQAFEEARAASVTSESLIGLVMWRPSSGTSMHQILQTADRQNWGRTAF